MNILVTNDDGVTAPGLLVLARVMHPFGNIKTLAPDHNWSRSGNKYRYNIRWVSFDNAITA
jgi:5'-nucleotidase